MRRKVSELEEYLEQYYEMIPDNKIDNMIDSSLYEIDYHYTLFKSNGVYHWNSFNTKRIYS